jgi:hypothetical protein
MIIALLNKSSRYAANGDLLTTMAAAVSQQLGVVASLWGMQAWSCIYFADEKSVPAGAYKLWVLNDADQADALGYHDQDPSGTPYGRVFVNPIIKSGGTDFTGPNSVSATISHEACEILGDPEVNVWRQLPDGRLTCQELCDAVEGDAYPILINGKNIFVSNFLLPPWFDYSPKAGSKFDYMSKLKAPFKMTKGGYMIMMSGGRVSYLYGSKQAEVTHTNNSSKHHTAARGMRRKKAFSVSVPISFPVVKVTAEEAVKEEKSEAVKEPVKAIKRAKKAGRKGSSDAV